MTTLRHALRLIRVSPGFSAVAIVTLALAIGANAATFSFVNGALLRPLPYPDADRIVRVLERTPAGALNGISTLNYLDWTSQNSVFEFIAAEVGWRAALTGGDAPVVIRGARVSPQYFDIFGVKASQGRTFLHDEDQPGKDAVVLLSHGLWKSRFGSDPEILERQIVLDGVSHSVVGILPEDGPFDRAAAQIWKPLSFEYSRRTRDYRWLAATAKLKPGVTLEQARAGMDVVGQRLSSEYPDSNKGWGVAIDRLSDVLISPDFSAAVKMLFAATLFVLLIGCANLSNLTLARSVVRDNEMAVRTALGAGPGRLLRLLLVESVVLSICGGIAGIAVGYAMLRWIQSLMPPYTLPPAVDVSMDMSVLLFMLIVAIVSGLLIGAAAAARAMKLPTVSALKEGGYGMTMGRTGGRVRGALVVTEVALAFVLLVASGLLMRSFINLLDIDPGFDATNVVTAGLPISPEQHPDPVALNSYLASIRSSVDAIPGVRATALTSALPLEGWGFGTRYAIAGRNSADRMNRRAAFFKVISPSYFDALGIKLRAGRLLSDTDTTGAPPVAVINETLARREFEGQDPIGQRILVREIVAGKSELGQEIAWEIAGVVASEKVNGLGDETSAGMYVSNQQSPTYNINLIVRTDREPESLQKNVRAAIDRVNKDQALADVRTLEQIVAQSLVANRVTSILFSVFASLALLLAAIGIYGIVSYTTAQRTQELAIRAALGAGVKDLRKLIFLGGMRMTVVGLAIGLAVTLAAARVMSSMLYGVGAADPLTIVVVAGVLSAVAGLACYLPARRITRAYFGPPPRQNPGSPKKMPGVPFGSS